MNSMTYTTAIPVYDNNFHISSAAYQGGLAWRLDDGPTPWRGLVLDRSIIKNITFYKRLRRLRSLPSQGKFFASTKSYELELPRVNAVTTDEAKRSMFQVYRVEQGANMWGAIAQAYAGGTVCPRPEWTGDEGNQAGPSKKQYTEPPS